MIGNQGDLEAQFTFESEKTGVVDEPPFLVLVMGDWTGDGDRREIAERRPIEIDRDDFDAVMRRLKPRLNLPMPGAPTITLEFNEIDDFHPDNIFRSVDVFADLRDLRRRLKSSDGFNDAAREVRSWRPAAARESPAEELPSRSAEPAAEPPAGDLLEQILQTPGGGSGRPRSSAASSELGSLVSELVRPHLVSVDEDEQASLVAAVDEATSSLMRQIIHDHRFQALESAWRGLYFLVRRTETDTDLKIFLLDISQDELCADLKSVEHLSDSLYYKILITEASETPGADPWAAAFGNFAFRPTADDVAALIRISMISAGADVPFVSHMRPEVIGVRSLAEHPDPKEWKFSTDTDAGKLWAALRTRPESEYLGLTIPRLLARIPYGAGTDPLESFEFEEFADGPEHDRYLWMNGCFAAATLLAQSYTASGWRMGRRLIQDIEGLPIHVHKVDGADHYTPCAEVQMTQAGCEMLVEYGLMPLVSYKNSDRIKVARFQSVTDPVTALKGPWS